MPVQCVRCTHFTLKPRDGEQAHYAASDRAHARAGMGRCAHETLALRWEGAERMRECSKHEEADAKTYSARVRWLDEQRQRRAG